MYTTVNLKNNSLVSLNRDSPSFSEITGEEKKVPYAFCCNILVRNASATYCKGCGHALFWKQAKEDFLTEIERRERARYVKGRKAKPPACPRCGKESWECTCALEEKK